MTSRVTHFSTNSSKLRKILDLDVGSVEMTKHSFEDSIGHAPFSSFEYIFYSKPTSP